MSEVEGPGPEFSEKESQKLDFLKDQVEKGKVGGLDDKPAQERGPSEHQEFPKWEQIDPAWKDLPPELREEFLDKFGGKVDNEDLLGLMNEFEETTDVSENLHSYIESALNRIKAHLEGREPLFGEEGERGLYSNELIGDPKEQFFQILEKRFPDLGITVRSDAIGIDGKKLEGFSAIWIDPTKRADVAPRIHRLFEENKAMQFFQMFKLKGTQHAREVGQQLEQQGILPSGVTARFYARYLKDMIEGLRSSFDELEIGEKVVKDMQEEFDGLRVEPMTDEELQIFLLEKVIIPEFGPPQEPAK